MGIEIERKFLVTDDSFKESSVTSIDTYFQAYIHIGDKKNIRIRIINNEKSYITIKYNTENNLRRHEFEYEIPLSDAIDISINCTEYLLKKRYTIPYKNRIWTVDEYIDSKCNGLVTAEVELDNENQKFKKPKWVGPEITGNPQYCNSNLTKTNHII
jgi:adenylate cyclase